MEEKNIALLGFVSSAADYLREQIKDDGDEIKTLEDVDLNKIKSELENKLGSSFDSAKNHSKIQSCQVQSSFAVAEKRSDDEKTAGNTLCIYKVFEDVWAFFCPSKPCVSLSIEGNNK